MAKVSAGSRGLNIGPGGDSGRSRELLRIGGLAAVIVIAVVVVVIYNWSDDAPPRDEGLKAMAQCLDCDAKFKIDPYAEQDPSEDSRNTWRVARYTCPECKVKHRSLPMTQCPDKDNCGKFFLAANTVREYEDELATRKGRRPRGRNALPPVTCDHCKIDVLKFKQAQRKRNR